MQSKISNEKEGGERDKEEEQIKVHIRIRPMRN